MSVATGANTILVYRWEDDGAYAQDPGEVSDTENKVFGAGESLDSQDRANNAERLYGPGSRKTEYILEAQFEGDWSTEFTFSNTWWFQFIFGKPSSTSIVDDTGTPPEYTHTYNTDPTNPPRSAQIIEEIQYPDGTVHQTIYKGVVATSADVEASTEDTATVSLDGFYADEEFYEDPTNGPIGKIGTQPETEYRPLHFGNAELLMDLEGSGSVTSKALVQDATVSMEANAEQTYELGTRFTVAPQFLAFEPELDYTALVNADNKDEERRASYGSVTATSPQETIISDDIEGRFDLINALDDENSSAKIKTLGTFPDDFSRANVGDPEEAIEDDVTRPARDIEVTVTADVQTPL